MKNFFFLFSFFYFLLRQLQNIFYGLNIFNIFIESEFVLLVCHGCTILREGVVSRWWCFNAEAGGRV